MTAAQCVLQAPPRIGLWGRRGSGVSQGPFDLMELLRGFLQGEKISSSQLREAEAEESFDSKPTYMILNRMVSGE